MRRALSIILALALALGQGAPLAWAKDLGLGEERKIGQEAFDEIMASVPMVKDPDCVQYVRGLGAKLGRVLDDERYQFRFYLADDPDMNAFAIPGGWIFIFRGMIQNLQSEGELISVMAHEMAHVNYRHIASRMKKGGAVQAATIAGMAAGVLLALMGASPQLSQALTMGSVAGGVQTMLAYSREDELQADFGGFKLMSQAGYDPAEMAATFRRLYREQRMMLGSVPTYLLTHPTSPQRLEVIDNLMRRHRGRYKPYGNRRFLVVRTRLAALYEPVHQAEEQFLQALQRDRNDHMALYGLALTRMRQGQYQKALNNLGHLARFWKNDPLLWRAQGLCHLYMGDYPQALDLLRRTLVYRPDDLTAQLGLGQGLVHEKKLDEAIHVLKKLVRGQPDNQRGQFELGVALGRAGRTAEASYHLGLSFLEQKNLRTAKYHLERAKRDLTDPDLKQKVDEALAKLKKAEKRKAKKDRALEERQP